MEYKRHIWRVWANKMHSWGLTEIIAWIFEISGPITFLIAQTSYTLEPFVTWIIPKNNFLLLIELFEDKEKKEDFLSFIRQIQ